jgi:hypothetical protein
MSADALIVVFEARREAPGLGILCILLYEKIFVVCDDVWGGGDRAERGAAVG